MDSTKFERNSSLDNNAWSEVENKYKLKTSFQYSPFSNCQIHLTYIPPLPKIELRNHCFQFLMGRTVFKREIKNNGSAK